jgi:hypothetical protein
MFAAFFFLSMSGGKVSRDHYNELKIRKGCALMFALSCDNEMADETWIGDFERYAVLLDTYCTSLSFTLMKSAIPGPTDECREAVRDFLTYNLRGYASAKLISNPSIPGFLEEMGELAQRFCASKEII